MDSDDEWLEDTPAANRYIVRQRTLLRSPLYPLNEHREEIHVKDSPLTSWDYLSNIRNYIWNRQTKRFCARDSLEWAQFGCYYCAFLFVLGLLFSSLVIVYMLVLDKKTPKLFGNSSAMALDGGINPGKSRSVKNVCRTKTRSSMSSR